MECIIENISATVHEVLGKYGAMDYKIKAPIKGTKVCGSAITVLVPGFC